MNKPAGLIHALLLDGTGGASEYDWRNTGAWTPEHGCLWLHFNFEDPEARQWLEFDSGLNDIAYNSLISDETRPRVLNRGGNLLITVRGINQNPGDDPEDMVSLRIWTDGTRIISTRRRRLVSTQDILDDLEHGNGACNAVELLTAWIERITARMNDTIEDYEDKVLALEERLLVGDTDGIRTELAHIRRQIISVRRYLTPQREAMNRLVNESLPWLDDMNRLRLREITDQLIRHIENIDEVRDRAVLAQEELSNQISERMNEKSYLFTVVAVIFLPLGFLTGLMGINVGGMPGLEDDKAFWVVAVLCLLVAIALTLVFKFRKWL